MGLAPDFEASLLGEPVLVTGASGYAASWLVGALCDLGFATVIAGDVSLPVGGGDPRARTVRLDVTVPATLEAALACGVRIVFHCAALVPFNLSRRYSAEELKRVNVDGTANVLTACRAAGVRNFIFMSSTGVSFRGADIAGGNEASATPACLPAHSNDAYSFSKAAAEALVLAGKLSCHSYVEVGRFACLRFCPSSLSQLA